MTAPTPAHILDYRAPEYDEAAVKLRGTLPEWLRGSLIRTAAAGFCEGAFSAAHLFDALCSICAFELKPDGSIIYRQRLLESQQRKQLQSGQNVTPHFYTDMRRPPLERLLSPVPRSNDNTNVNILPFADELVAMTETNVQHSIDRDTLRTLGHVRYDDEHRNKLFMLAHPRLDRARGLIVNVGTLIGSSPALVVYEHVFREHKRRILARIAMTELPYMHSFGLTPQHALLFAGPLLLSPWRLLWSERGFIRHFRYRPERGSRIYCVDRATGSVRTHRAPPLFVFHVIHAFERSDETVLDVLAYDDPSIIESLSVASLRRAWPEVNPRPLRMVLRRNSEEVSVEPLCDDSFEFPTLHEPASDGHGYRNVWGATGSTQGSEYRSGIVHLDPERGTVSRFEESGFAFGEPLFVPRPGASDERDGALLSVASHLSEPRSALVVLDADSLTVRAWGELDRPAPFSFHGCFSRSGRCCPKRGKVEPDALERRAARELACAKQVR